MDEINQEQAEILDLAHVLVRDMDDGITYWNKGNEQLYGYTKDEAMGRVSHDLLKTDLPVPLEQIREKLLADDY